MNRLPVLFLGHGNPMNVLDAANRFNLGFARVAQSFPKPRAILMVSAHWYGLALEVSSAAQPELIYDFYGFPDTLYQVGYPAAGSPDLAARTAELLSDSGIRQNPARGLDHGTWAVLKHLYPEANIPVVQLSIDSRLTAAEHFELARKLRPLRDEGVLIVGSGNIVHNLRLMDRNRPDDPLCYGWAATFAEHINRALQQGDTQSLIGYDGLGENAALAVPTPEHYLPLLYVAALRDEDEQAAIFNDEIVGGSLSMTSVKIG